MKKLLFGFIFTTITALGVGTALSGQTIFADEVEAPETPIIEAIQERMGSGFRFKGFLEKLAYDADLSAQVEAYIAEYELSPGVALHYALLVNADLYSLEALLEMTQDELHAVYHDAITEGLITNPISEGAKGEAVGTRVQEFVKQQIQHQRGRQNNHQN
jgi:hypothetical protein